MFWADKLAKEIIDSGKHKPYWVDDMKTPSGRIHVGSLRGVLMHDLVYKALLDAGQKVTFTYVFEDHDPMDGLPVYLDQKKWSQYLGQPLFTVPSPDGKAKHYGEYFALEFKEVFNKVGAHPTIIWGSDLYKSGKMNEGVKLFLDNAAEVRAIYEEMYEKKLADNWYPFQVVCPTCGKMSTTRVTAWDGKEVTFVCKVDAVEWTKGCGFEGKTSPFSGDGKFAGKLSWKVEWPLKWKVIGVTIEGAGKDHMSAGGSHDIAEQICKRVLHSDVPFPIAHEFFLIGGKKMSSSKGIGSSAKEVSDIMPPYLVRFMFTRIDYNIAINFDPVGTMAIPDLFDEYDRCWQAYVDGSDEHMGRAFEMAQIGEKPEKKKIFLPRFREVVNYVQQPSVEIKQKFAEIKGSTLISQELEILEERISYAKIWIEKYAPEEFRQVMLAAIPKEVHTLSLEQKNYLDKVAQLVENASSSDDLQMALYNAAKESGLDIKKAFGAIYTAFIGKTHGPRAGAFLLQYPKDQVLARLKEVNSSLRESEVSREVSLISKPEFFTIDPAVTKKYPSVTVGIAVIKDVNITKSDPKLEDEKNRLLESLQGLSNETLGTYPEIVSYRKLYKEMGIDWHSRRPSPEALLRRIALRKGLYSINTCVDAYNLVVMKNRVSVGAFDLDQIKFPTVLRYAKEGEEILLLGDKEPTKYTAKELAYFDQVGGYNMDFNYRDAKRTMVTENTKNLWINVEGVFDITPEQVEESLQESVAIITKYCGGTVEFSGIVK